LDELRVLLTDMNRMKQFYFLENRTPYNVLHRKTVQKIREILSITDEQISPSTSAED
jgi:hypothetical protein